MIQKVPLRGYRNIFSHIFQSHDESSMSTLWTSILFIRYMFQYALPMQRSTKRMCQSQKKKKVLVLWCTYFLLLTFSVHFVVRKRMLILNAPSLFFTELFELTLLFSFFNAPCHLFTKTVNVSSNHWPTRTSFVVLSIVKKSHAHTITTSVLSFIFIRHDRRCRFSKYPLLSTKIWNNTFFLSSVFHWSVIFRSSRNVTVGFLQKDS